MALKLANAAEPETHTQPPKKKACGGRGGRYWAVTWFKEDLPEPEGDLMYMDPMIHPQLLNLDWVDRGLVYAIYQVERCPTTKRLHLQMFLQYKNQVRLSTLTDMFPGCHAELCRASEKDNERYCSKNESRIAGPWTYGTKTSQGKRTDWDHVKEMAAAGLKRRDILLEHPKLAPCHKGIDVLIAAVKGPAPVTRDIQVWLLHGETRVGKTHRACTKFPEAYRICGRYYEGKSFDGYDGQSELILDEWDSTEWPITLMNDILDKWRCELQCRYFNKTAYWTKVVICSNLDPETYYAGVGQTTRAAFFRRLTHIIHVETQEQEINFD